MTAREVAYRSIDVANDQRGFDELRELGVTTVPVVVVGQDWVIGVNLSEVARLLDLDHDDAPVLTPAVLVARLDRVLETASRLTNQIPEHRLRDKLPRRDRSYQGLANHIVEIAVCFVEVTAGAPLTGTRAAAEPEMEYEPGSLTIRAESVRAAVAIWWAETEDHDCGRVVETYAGPQSLHQVLERTAWHCAQHVRQLTMVLDVLDVPIDRPLSTADLDGLPVPAGVWDG